jgi:hypothetical protein
VTRTWLPAGLAILAAGMVIRSIPAPSTGPFDDRSENSGIRFVLNNSATPEKHQIETMPGGVAVFDYDNDGYPDIYLVNGAAQPSLRKNEPKYWNRLYRNKGNFVFEDVTEKAGVAGNGYNIGVAAGDFDNDGHVDLFVTGVNGNTLFRNRGDGTFEDVTQRAGLASDRWAISAAWVDYDNDGLLDLFLVNYVKWDPAREIFCGEPSTKIRTYCHPRFYEPLANRLYHNNGDGTFTDVSERAGIGAHLGKGMGVAVADYDHDGRMDIFVANDTLPNFLFHNEGAGKFSEAALTAGVALKDDAKATSSMGVDFRDIDNDGAEDLIVTALAGETFPLFMNLGKGLFSDMTYTNRVGPVSLGLSGWSAGIVDFDNDGWKDIFTANGDVQDNSELLSSQKSRQPNLFLLNDGHGKFSGKVFGQAAQHRGAAFGDFDRDGRVDVVVTRLNESPVLLRNVMGADNHWLGLKLVGTRSNRDAIGARIVVRTGKLTQVNHVSTAVGYASSSDSVLHFGLGKSTQADQIDIEWPSGARQQLKNVKADQYLTIREETN